MDGHSLCLRLCKTTVQSRSHLYPLSLLAAASRRRVSTSGLISSASWSLAGLAGHPHAHQCLPSALHESPSTGGLRSNGGRRRAGSTAQTRATSSFRLLCQGVGVASLLLQKRILPTRAEEWEGKESHFDSQAHCSDGVYLFHASSGLSSGAMPACPPYSALRQTANPRPRPTSPAPRRRPGPG
jgi:hypothetical protein